MFPMTITVSNAAQLNAIMTALHFDTQTTSNAVEIVAENIGAGSGDVSAKAEKVVEKKPATATKQESTASTQLTATVEAGAAAEKKDDAPASHKSISYEDLSKAILAVSAAKGRQAALDVLGKHDLTHAKNAKPEQYAAILATANEVLSA